MNDARFTEAVVDKAALAWLEALGYDVVCGPEIASGELAVVQGALPPKLISGDLRHTWQLITAFTTDQEHRRRRLRQKREEAGNG